jgi:hypothetical protein
LWEFVKKILNQGHAGSCTGNGWAGAKALLACKPLGQAVWVSVLYLYWYERQRNGDTATDAGAMVSDGAFVLSQRGAPLDADYPYSDDPRAVVQKPPAALDSKAAAHKILNPMSVSADFDHIKARLLAGYPVVFGFEVYESFESTATLRTGVVTMPTADEGLLGGHCMYFIGATGEGNVQARSRAAAVTHSIRDAVRKIAQRVKVATGLSILPTRLPDDCLIGVNSWGSEVGDGGRFYFPKAFVEQYASDFYTFDGETEH